MGGRGWGGDGSEWEGRGGEGRVEKNGGGTWSVTNDNSTVIYTFLNLFNYKRKKQNKIRKKILSYKRDSLLMSQ